MNEEQLKKKTKAILFDMEFDEAIEYLQELLDYMEEHPENDMDGSPVVYYP
jgi:hypothetical protein